MSTLVPSKAAGELIAKYTPGSSTAAQIRAMIATNDSMSMPPYPIIRISRSLFTSFGVVPDDTKAWKPEIAPQAMVINKNGNIEPANTGPVPSINCVNAGSFISGIAKIIPTAKPAITPIFKKVDK